MIDLYSVPTANGQRVHIMLEETGLPYTAHVVDLPGGGHLAEDFRQKNPFGRVPALIDHDAPSGDSITLFEGHAILFYLAEKAGMFYPRDLATQAEVHMWMGAISANIAPAFSAQFWFTVIAPEGGEAALKRALSEAHRGLAALDVHLEGRDFIAGEEYTIADIHAYPVAATSAARLDGGLDGYAHIQKWAEGIAKRPGVQRGMKVLADAH